MQKTAQTSRPISLIFFFVFFGFMLFEAGRLFWPFIGSIGSAIVLSVVFKPWYDALGRRFKRLQPTWRALLLDLLVFILFVIPIIILIWAAVAEAGDLYPILAEKFSQAAHWFHQSPSQSFPWLKKIPASITNSFSLRSTQLQSRLSESGQRAFTVLAGFSTLAARRLIDAAIDSLIMIFCLFFMFRDGENIYAQALRLIPLSTQAKIRLSQTTQRTIVGVVRGTFLMSLAQTTLMAIGLVAVHADAIVLLSFLTFATTFIPTIGTAIISVPAALYFFFAVAHWKGVFLLLWGTLGMGILDNILRPLLVGAGEDMSFFWLFFAILGGLEAFGIPGLLLGPLILCLMPVLFEIYRDRYLDIPED